MNSKKPSRGHYTKSFPRPKQANQIITLDADYDVSPKPRTSSSVIDLTMSSDEEPAKRPTSFNSANKPASSSSHGGIQSGARGHQKKSVAKSHPPTSTLLPVHSKAKSPSTTPGARNRAPLNSTSPAIKFSPSSIVSAQPRQTSPVSNATNTAPASPASPSVKVPSLSKQHRVINEAKAVVRPEQECENEVFEHVAGPTTPPVAAKGTPSIYSDDDEPERIHNIFADKPSNKTGKGLSGTPAKPRASRLGSRVPSFIKTTSPMREMSSESPTAEQLKQSLHQLYQRMKDVHALTVKWQLHDAKMAARNALQPYMDKVSPWASLKGLKDLPNVADALPPGILMGTIGSHVQGKNGKGKLRHTVSRYAATTFEDSRPMLPNYTSVTYAKRNHRTADDAILHFMPYMKESEDGTGKMKSTVMELEDAHSANRAKPSREAEFAAEIRCHLDSWLSELQLGCDERSLQRHLLDPSSNWQGIEKNATNLDELLQHLGGPLPENINKRAAMFLAAFTRVFEYDLSDVVLPELHLREMIKEASRPLADDPPGRLSTFSDLMCLVCGAFDCQFHGDYAMEFNSEDDEEEYVHIPLVMKIEDIRRQFKVRKAASKNFDPPHGQRGKRRAPCSENCYKNLNGKYAAWSNADIDTLQDVMFSISDADHQACTISYGLDMPCWQVYQELIKLQERRRRKETITTTNSEPQSISDRPIWYNNSKKKLVGAWSQRTLAHSIEQRKPFRPCAHEGPCVGDCPCSRLDVLCESMCGCADDCGRKFTGCACAASGINCVYDYCICISMNRECGAQCGTCGALERLKPANRHNDELFLTGCQNVVLQRGVFPATSAGTSQLAGIGLYIAESVRKGAFLGEYVGELLSHAESERRGILYDRGLLSYLFNLHEWWTIDAAKVANKTRYMNHAEYERNGLNCEAKIMLVNGISRIKFFALRDIEAWEELLFNYGKKFAERHGLSKKGLKGQMGVIVDKEGLDALDGVDLEQRVSRKNMKLFREEHQHQGYGKARKTTTRKPAVPDVIEDESQGSDFDPQAYDEEGWDEENEDRRSARGTRIPKKYTR